MNAPPRTRVGNAIEELSVSDQLHYGEGVTIELGPRAFDEAIKHFGLRVVWLDDRTARVGVGATIRRVGQRR
jgi:hypothetical protein